MNVLVIAFLVVIAVGALAVIVRSRSTPTYRVRLADIPRVIEAVAASPARPAFAVFMFNLPGHPGPDDAVNLQVSLDGSRLGVDWVLEGRRNIDDEARFTECARAGGFEPRAMEMNGVRYLRVERGDLAKLCRDVLTTLFDRDETDVMDLIAEGFRWKP